MLWVGIFLMGIITCWISRRDPVCSQRNQRAAAALIQHDLLERLAISANLISESASLLVGGIIMWLVRNCNLTANHLARTRSSIDFRTVITTVS